MDILLPVEQYVRSRELGSFEIGQLPEQDHLPRIDLRAHLEAGEVDAARDLLTAVIDAAPGDRVLSAWQRAVLQRRDPPAPHIVQFYEHGCRARGAGFRFAHRKAYDRRRVEGIGIVLLER